MALSRRRALAGAPLALAACMAPAAVASCGARTGLPRLEVADAGADVGLLSPDRFFTEDSVEERGEAEADVLEELPPIDASVPDVQLSRFCPDAAATLIYVISVTNVLYSFDPSADVFTRIGTIVCPDMGSNTAFSMAVDREGIAYVVFTSGLLYRVSTKTADCRATAYDPASNANMSFGMGFVADVGDGGDGAETLFVAPYPHDFAGDSSLAKIDTTTFAFTPIGNFTPTVEGAELTGTGAGRLFAFSPAATPSETSFIAEVDPTTAMVIAEDTLPGIVQGAGWAFGFWGGDFYTFTTDAQTDPMTRVHQFDPALKTITQVATLGDTVVGAGVSTCAPQD
jgi:hypothetical protein